MQLMKQKQYAPISFDQQSVIIYALNSGLLDDVDVDRILEFEEKFLYFMQSSGASVLKAIQESKKVEEATEEELKNFIAEFKKTF